MKKFLIPFIFIHLSVFCVFKSTAQSLEASYAGSPPFEVSIYGQGRPILLIPGLSSSKKVWQEVIAELQPEYQLHAFQLAGFAGTAPLSEAELKTGFLHIQQQAIAKYIEDRNLKKPVIIGHSLGGFLALQLAIKQPELVAAVINIDALPALGAIFNTTSETDDAHSETFDEQSFDPSLIAQSMSLNTAWHPRILEDMFSSDPATAQQAMTELMIADLRQELDRLQIPTLTLGALQNGAPYSTPEQVKQNYLTQFENAPNAYHQMYFSEKSKHFIMADDPVWLIEKIKKFLTSP